MPWILLILVILTLTESGQTLVNWEERAYEVRLDELVRDVLPEVLLTKDVNLTHNFKCSRDLVAYRQGIDSRDVWAVKMFDASSKMPTGLMQGHLMDIGMFDECRNVLQDKIHGQSCQYSFDPAPEKSILPFNPVLSICVPDSCTADEVGLLVNEAILASDKLMGVGAKVGNVVCISDDPKTPDMGFIIFILLHVACLGFCTFCDIIQSRGVKIESKLLQTLIRFSLLKSTKSIFNMQTDQSDLPVIHGLRVVHNMGVILLHAEIFNLVDLNANLFFVQEAYSHLSALMFFLTMYCVDTFFVLSGFLAAYGFFRKMQRGQKPSILFYYLHRYIRLSLPVIVFLYGTIKLTPWFCSGPRYELLMTSLNGCSSKWWSYIFYAQNFIKRDDLCLLHLWSLAVDMHLFWISPLIFYPLYKNRKIGITILTAFFMISIISTATIVWTNSNSAVYTTREMIYSRIKKQLVDTYFATYTRASPWFLGAFFGYEVVQKNVTPNKRLLIIGWGLALGALTFIVGGILIFMNVHYEYNAVFEVIFATFSRPAWGFGVCWIIYASFHDFGGFMSKILSSKLFLPLSRLSYCMYISHPTLLGLKLIFARTSSYLSVFAIAFSFIKLLPLIVAFGFCYSILFERPMFVLEDLIFRKKTKDISERQKIK